MAGERKFARNLTGPGSAARLRETVAEALKESHISVSTSLNLHSDSLTDMCEIIMIIINMNYPWQLIEQVFTWNLAERYESE